MGVIVIIVPLKGNFVAINFQWFPCNRAICELIGIVKNVFFYFSFGADFIIILIDCTVFDLDHEILCRTYSGNGLSECVSFCEFN